MKLEVRKLDLFWDGEVPRDSLGGGIHRQLFGEAKPLIDYAFKVERPAFVRVWWFDRHLERVVDFQKAGGRPKRGRFYDTDYLISVTDVQVADYLAELGWQVRMTVQSFARREHAVLAVFSPQGAILEESERYRLRTLTEQEWPPAPDMPPVWMPAPVPQPNQAVVADARRSGPW